MLAWTLRNDPRVTVMERTNAMHANPPAGPVDPVVVDLAWTPQKHAIPAALRWLKPGGRVISLVKPHYETEPAEKPLLVRGVLPEAEADLIAHWTVDSLSSLSSLGVRTLGLARSPIEGGAGKGKKGNAEWLVLLERALPASMPALVASRPRSLARSACARVNSPRSAASMIVRSSA